MTETTASLLKLGDEYGAHNYHPLPVVAAEAAGAWVTDVEGRRYLDMLAAYSALNFGHAHPRLVAAAHVRQHAVEVGLRREDVRAEPLHGPRVQLEHAPAVEERLRAAAAQDEPRAPEHRVTGRAHAPAARHAQVAAHRHAALEAQDQVLADCLDGLEPAPVHLLGDARRAAARVRHP